MSEVKPADFRIVLVSMFGLDFGVMALDAYLRARGYRPLIVGFKHLKIPLEYMNNDYFSASPMDHTLFPRKDRELLLGQLARLDPHLIGVSVSSVSFRTARWLTRAIRQRFSARVIWGGVHAILSPEDCIGEADFVCIGEGEGALVELVEALRRGRQPAGLKNLWIRQGQEVEKNPLRPLIADLDELPWPDRITADRVFIDDGRMVRRPVINAGYMTNAYPMMTSRGCMFTCSFCCNSVISRRYKGQGPYMRRRSVDHVLDELRHAVRRSEVASVRFWDDVFTYDEGWIDEFCSRYPREVGRSFICYAHPHRTSQRVLEQLSGAGLTMVYVGIQSGSRKTNTTYFNRAQSNRQIRSFARRARALQITPNYDVIVDNAFESEQDNNETIELLLTLPRPFKVLFFSLCFFPKTPLSLQALEKGIIRDEQLEHNTSKALNNFFLVLDRSPRPEQLFWSCIKAMAVNPAFPKVLVRRLHDSRLLRRHPELLLALGRCLVRLRRSRGRPRQQGWLLPAITEGGHLDDYILWTGNRHLYRQMRLRQTLHPAGTGPEGSRLRLRLGEQVRCQADGLQLEVLSFTERDLRRRSVWRLGRGLDLTGPNTLILNIDFPRVTCGWDQQPPLAVEPLRLVHEASDHEALFVVWLKLLRRGTVLRHRLHAYPLAQSLCLLEAR